MCRRLFLLCLIGVVLLCGCRSPQTVAPAPLTAEITTYQGDGYVLTYPACFALQSDGAGMVRFAVPGRSMAFAVTIEPHSYGTLSPEEYPRVMGIEQEVIWQSENSFGVEKYLPNVLSGYYLYAFTKDTLVLLEYNYSGTPEERAMQSLFSITITK